MRLLEQVRRATEKRRAHFQEGGLLGLVVFFARFRYLELSLQESPGSIGLLISNSET